MSRGLWLGGQRNKTLLETIIHAMEQSPKMDPESYSPRTKAAALKFAEYIFSKTSTISPEQVLLGITVMKNRNCGSPVILKSLIQLGLEYRESGDLEMARLICESIRNDQLKRWESVKSLFHDEDLEPRMIDLLTAFPGQEHSIHRTRVKKIPSLEPTDLQSSGRPVFRCGNQYVYYTSNGAWQLGADINREYLKRACIISDSPSPPRDWSQWKFFSSRTPVTPPRDAKIAASRSSYLPEQPKENNLTDVLDVWESVSVSPPAPVAKVSGEMEKLENLVKELGDKLVRLETDIDDLRRSSCVSNTQKESVHVSSGNGRWDIGSIISKVIPAHAPLRSVGAITGSFDEFRADIIRREKAAVTRAIVARKLGTK